MLSRRRLLHTSMIATCACAIPRIALPVSPTAARTDGSIADIGSSAGCMVRSTDFQQERLGALGAGDRAMNFTIGQEQFRVVASSGNRYFDRALAEALLHISKTFDVLPTFGFIQGGNYANALATPAPYLPEDGDAPLPTRKHGTVLFGDGMLAFMEQNGTENPVAAALAICAHEFGHIVQYNYQVDGRFVIDILNEGQPTVRRGELHADFLTGYYVGVAKRRNPDTPAASIARAAHSIGDWNVDSKGHHGTPEERGAAVYEGYRHSFEMQKPFKQALVDGLVYLEALPG